MPKSHDISSLYRTSRQKSTDWYKRASDVLAGKVGHDLRYFEPVPLCIKHGLGARKWDIDNNEYIDFLMGNGALLLGHSHKDVLQAITQAMDRGTHFGNDHPLHIEWAELVQRLVPSAERVRFVNSGTEATLLAIRLARAFTGKNKLLRFEGHFHGWHDAVIHDFQPPFGADGSLGVPSNVRENTLTLPDGDLEAVAKMLDHEKDVAAVIIEPSGASWGRVPIESVFLDGLRNITEQHGVMLIFDEVITGFRFSVGGAQELYNILPDLTCLAKIVAGGMPGGAVVGRDDIMALFDHTGDSKHDRFERVTHFGTFNGTPLSAAAGIAVLEQVATGTPIKKANLKAQELRTAWGEVLQKHSVAGYVYGCCSTFHIYFETDQDRLGNISKSVDLHTTDPKRLKGMPIQLVNQYQLLLRYHGVDNMSSTGGVLSAVHTGQDIKDATEVFEKTVLTLLEEGQIYTL